MSYSIKKGFSRKINDPETAISKLNKAHKAVLDFLNSGEAFADEDETQYYKVDGDLQEWAAEPREILPQPLVNNNMLPPSGGQGSPAMINLPGQGQIFPPAFLPQNSTNSMRQAGYPAAIVVSIVLAMLTFMTYDRLFTAQLAFYFGIVSVGLFFAFAFSGPIIEALSRLAQALLNRAGTKGDEEKKKTVGDLFEDAHELYNDTWLGNKKQMTEEEEGIWKDSLVTQKKRLVGIYWRIKAISETEWYTRKLINDSNTIRMSNGQGNVPTSDYAG